MPSLAATEPTIADIRAAAQRIRSAVAPTPLLTSPALDDQLGGRILLKPESLQRTGSFKIRGAYNFISQLDPAALATGVVAYSSGNHAQGVAAAARLCGTTATIVMPRDAPAVKLANTRAYGAEIVLYDRATEVREHIAGAIAAERGAPIVPPYDHPWTIAGQGTAGLELAQQATALDAQLDAVLICCGGGGLTGGIALALAAESPSTAVYAVEPEGYDDTARSLAAGERVGVSVDRPSVCDALLAPTPGALTFAINRRLLRGGLSVTDDEALAAVAFAFSTLKLVVEPGGAVALAAVLTRRFDAAGKTVAVVLSGGNVDARLFSTAVALGAGSGAGSG